MKFLLISYSLNRFPAPVLELKEVTSCTNSLRLYLAPD